MSAMPPAGLAVRWIPEAYLEEVSPPPRATPSDWIIKLPDGRCALAPNDDDIDDPPPQDLLARAEANPDSVTILEDGAAVPFAWLHSFGRDILFINADNLPEFERWGRTPEVAGADTIMCIAGESETLDHTAAGLVENCADEFEPDSEGKRLAPVDLWAWSIKPVPMVFSRGEFHPAALPAGDAPC